jgi:hypothetical protein
MPLAPFDSLSIDRISQFSEKNQMQFPFILLSFITILSAISFTLYGEENRIPFYEDYLKDSDSGGFLQSARKFLEETPEAIEAPRISHDYLMVAKASRDIEAINFATSKLLFTYPNSLPTIHFITSFDRESKTLTKLLIGKATYGDLKSKEFAVAYCRALILVARTRGPEFLADSSLRLRAFLIAQTAEVDEVKSSALKALEVEATKDNGFAKIAQIAISSKTPIEKLSALSLYSGIDAEFATAYYLAQLTEEERKSEKILIIQLKQALFGSPSNIEKALRSIASLPSKIGKQPDVQTFLGAAQHLDGKPDLAVKTLSRIPTKSSNSIMAEWGKTAQSFANGIQFMENRKKLLLSALGKAIDQIDDEQDSLYAQLNLKSEDKNEASDITAFIGFSNQKKELEIHVIRNNETILAYRTNDGNSYLFSSDLNQSIKFKTPGVFPIPQLDIKRDVETGGFSSNFNLNFSPSQEKFLEEGNRLRENPYLGTAKGREVLLTYLLTEKPMWLSPAKTISGGTSYPLFQLDPENPKSTPILITMDLSNKLSGFQVGRFSISNLSLGDSTILNKMPDWPDTKSIEQEKFDFSVFMKVLQRISNMSQ